MVLYRINSVLLSKGGRAYASNDGRSTRYGPSCAIAGYQSSLDLVHDQEVNKSGFVHLPENLTQVVQVLIAKIPDHMRSLYRLHHEEGKEIYNYLNLTAERGMYYPATVVGESSRLLLLKVDGWGQELFIFSKKDGIPVNINDSRFTAAELFELFSGVGIGFSKMEAKALGRKVDPKKRLGFKLNSKSYLAHLKKAKRKFVYSPQTIGPKVAAIVRSYALKEEE